MRFDSLIQTVTNLKAGKGYATHLESPFYGPKDLEIITRDLKVKTVVVVEGFELAQTLVEVVEKPLHPGGINIKPDPVEDDFGAVRYK